LTSDALDQTAKHCALPMREKKKRNLFSYFLFNFIPQMVERKTKNKMVTQLNVHSFRSSAVFWDEEKKKEVIRKDI
jgi:hypothetical protein